MAIIGIVAADRNGAIGKGGKLPWHYSADMKHFKETTSGHACVMGYRTWQTLKKPLPNRLNIILSRQSEVEPPDSVIVCRDVPTVLSFARDLKCDLFVIGGEKVYRSFIPHCEKWLVTGAPLTAADADAFVPWNCMDECRTAGSREIGDELRVRVYE